MGIKLIKKNNEAGPKALEYTVGSTVNIKVALDGKFIVRCTPEYAAALGMGESAYVSGSATTISWNRDKYRPKILSSEYIAQELRSRVLGLVGKPLAERGRTFTFKDPIAVAKAAETVYKEVALPEYDAVAEKIRKDLQEILKEA